MKHKHHIIPRHMGGSDDPSNLIELTPEEHAEAHRLLYEEHGRWQDYVAWQGLAKYATKQETISMVLSESNRQRKGIKYNQANYNRKGENNPGAKEFIVTHPDGTTEKVKALKTWCESKELNYKTFHKMCVQRQRTHKGYAVSKI